MIKAQLERTEAGKIDILLDKIYPHVKIYWAKEEHGERHKRCLFIFSF